MLIDYDAYRAMGGDMGEAEFERAEALARGRLNWLTDGRIEGLDPVPENVKRAVKAVIDWDAAYAADRPLLTGFNADGYSETYGAAADQARAASAALNRALTHLLADVRGADGLLVLYRGV